MKQYELKAIIEYLKRFRYISRARRVEDNTIELSFNREDSIFFNMRRGGSFIYKSRSIRPLQSYNAPFDALLHSFVSNSKIINIEIPNDDRVIRFTLAPKSSYKEKQIALQFEFTGRYTNVILLDRGEIVIEALRHIDANSSFRVIRPSIRLKPIPPFKIKEKNIHKIEDIESFLEKKYIDFEKKRLEILKKQKLLAVIKKKEKLERLLSELAEPSSLVKEEKRYRDLGNIVLANLYRIKPYDRKLKTHDFEGKEIIIEFPQGILPNRVSEYFFNKAKKARGRARNIHIERENLITKLAFYSNMYYAIERAKTTHDLELLVPKRGKSKRKKEKIKECELFWIDDYKVLIGRNSKENQAILKMAKSNDIWMHIRGIPSSHLIIKTDKQNLPNSVIERAGKLCVDFSLKQAGNYTLDYCKRKFVKVQEGANVEYDKYKSIIIKKEIF